MSLLQQEESDDAARGEELTKGTSHVVIAALVATMVVSAAIALYAIVGQKPPFANGEITAIWVHPQHTETSGFDASGAPMPKQSVDQVMVFDHRAAARTRPITRSFSATSPPMSRSMTASTPATPPTKATTTASLSPIRTFRCRT